MTIMMIARDHGTHRARRDHGHRGPWLRSPV